MAEATSVVLPADPVGAPVDDTPAFSRSSFFQPPDWRYEEARSFLAAEQDGKLAPIPTDPAVQMLIRVLRALKDGCCTEYLNAKMQDIADVVHLGTYADNSDFALELETHIINGDKWEDIKTHKSWFTQDIYELFKLFFFDLTGIRAVTSWMSYHLFEPASSARSGLKLRTRLLAYYNGGDVALTTVGFGHSSPEGTAALKELAVTERHKRVVEYMLERTKLPAELYATVLESARKEADDRTMKRELQDAEAAGDATLQELAKNLADGIRSFTTEELEETDKFGLDYTNKYTHKILKDN